MSETTKIICLAVLGLLVVYDIVAYAVGGVDATISRRLLGWATNLPILLIAVGVLIGHLFWAQPRPPRDEK